MSAASQAIAAYMAQCFAAGCDVNEIAVALEGELIAGRIPGINANQDMLAKRHTELRRLVLGNVTLYDGRGWPAYHHVRFGLHCQWNVDNTGRGLSPVYTPRDALDLHLDHMVTHPPKEQT